MKGFRRNVVLKIQDQRIAGIHAQRGGLSTVFIDVAVAAVALGVLGSQKLESDLQHPMFAAEVFGLGSPASRNGARADVRCGGLRERGQSCRQECDGQKGQDSEHPGRSEHELES